MDLSNRSTKDPYQEIPIKDYSYINTQKNLPKNGKRWAWIVTGLIVLVLLGFGAFAYGHYTKTKTTKHSTSHKQVAKKPTSTAKISLTSYTSSVFGVTLSYPTSWTVTAEGNTSLDISSQETTLTADTGKSVDGKIVFNMVNQGQIPAAFGSNSVAVLNSQDINFSSPTSNQAAQTYISFVQYPATVIKGGLDAIYVTGNSGYLKDQSIPTTDVDQVSPLVIVNFEQCQNKACTTYTPLTISSTMWNNSTFSMPILDIIQSLSFS